jgi:siroheme synthase
MKFWEIPELRSIIAGHKYFEIPLTCEIIQNFFLFNFKYKRDSLKVSWNDVIKLLLKTISKQGLEDYRVVRLMQMNIVIFLSFQ